MIDLLLIDDVPHLGKKGDHVQVKPGFARNFLLPQSKAVFATSDNLKMVEKARVRWLAEEAKLVEELTELASHIEKLELKIVAKASDVGTLYGSVTEREIAAAAADAGVSFDAKYIRLPQPIRDVSDNDILIHLHEKVEVTIPVRVRAEGREDWMPGQEMSEEERAELEAAEAAKEAALDEAEERDRD